ncbi:hypothetical protein EW145_g7840 [Phellinidium pouzarii]|uniref:Acid phosphatase n=1 Tax=Phellinidium pouzarii TaxID=167371 RepID=A0A4S4KDL9_9AGAM|nr:hypothetical protein EW145_g7840 [Phellinidium pouzarii]
MVFSLDSASTSQMVIAAHTFLASLTLTVLSASMAAVAYNGVYNSSVTPSDLPWNTYNYCNAPHVNAAHYTKPANVSGSVLVYMNVMIRHHKRTPDNLYPEEAELNPPSGWDCTNFLQMNYGGGTAPVFHETDVPPWHPFLSQFWNGTCDEGQLTAAGLADAVKHGKVGLSLYLVLILASSPFLLFVSTSKLTQDFWSVYHDKVGFLQSVNPNDILVRTSTEPRTFQVAGGLLYGMDASTATKTWKVVTQPSTIDSLPPDYACPNADNVRAAYQSVPAWTDHLEQNADLQDRLGTTLGTTGLSAWTSWYDHFFDTFTSRTCNDHPLPCNSTGACVSEEDASRVHAIGDFEYNYIWNSAENATVYNQLTFGVMFMELAMNFRAFQSGTETHKLTFYVGHDGSMVRLASGLGFGKIAPLRWPALGSEIVMEVWQTPHSNDRFVRVMFEGTPVRGLDWVALDDFVTLLESNSPENLFEACTSAP